MVGGISQIDSRAMRMTAERNELKAERRSAGEEERIFEVCGCTTCPGKDVCELRDVVRYLDMDLAGFRVKERELPLEDEDPFFNRDYDLCILCGRCVRVCRDIRGNGAISLLHRGTRTRVGSAFGESHLDGPCMFCGACVDVCPTGALRIKDERYYGQAEESVTSACTLCGLGCATELKVKWGRVVNARPDPEGWNRGQGCVLGKFCLPRLDTSAPRVSVPMVRREGHLGSAGWDEAVDAVCRGLRRYRNDEIVFLVSRNLDNDSAEIMSNISSRGFPGSEKRCDAELGKLAHRYYRERPERFGKANIGERIARSGIVLIVGARPHLTHGEILVELKRARDNGAEIIYLGPGPYIRGRKGVEHFPTRRYSRTLIWLLKSYLETKGAENKDHRTGELQEVLEQHRPEAPGRPMDMDKWGGKKITVLLGRDIIEERPRLTLAAAHDLLEVSGNREGLFFLISGNSMGVLESMNGTPGIEEAGRKKKKAVFTTTTNTDIPEEAEFIVLQNPFFSTLSERADVILPSASATESGGVFTALDGREMTLKRAADPTGAAMEDSWILERIARRLDLEPAGGNVGTKEGNEDGSRGKKGRGGAAVARKRFMLPSAIENGETYKEEHPFTYRGYYIPDAVPDLETFIRRRRPDGGGDEDGP